MERPDFNSWNVVYMVVSFFNVVNISLMPDDQASQGILLSIYCFQAIIFTFLVFSKKVLSSLLTVIIPFVVFLSWSIFTGILDIVQIFFMHLISCLVVIITGIPRAKILKHVQEEPEESPETKKTMDDGNPRGLTREKRLFVVSDMSTTTVTITAAATIVISMKITPIWQLVPWAISTLVIVPIFLFVLDFIFIIFQTQPREFYHPIFTHHFIEESNHTFSATLGKVSIFFCTRCAGMLIGLFLSMYGFATLRIAVPPLFALVVDCFLPMPIFIDWGTQRLGFRQSTTRSRVITGAIVGLGFALVPQASPDYALGSSILLMVYFAIFILLFYVGMRRAPRMNDDELPLDNGLSPASPP